MLNKKVIIDCDPGIDDVLALAVAHQEPLDIIGISTVAGNVKLDYTYRNAELLKHVCGFETPIFKGAKFSMSPGFQPEYKADAASVHGNDGIGGLYEKYESTFTLPETAKGLAELRALIYATETPVTIIAVGPLTNIATLISADPSITERIEALYIMGGSFGMGNATPLVEYNFYVDPVAVDIVMTSGIKIVLAPLNVTHEVFLTESEYQNFDTTGTARTFIWDTLKYYTDRDPYLHDVVSVLSLTRPELFETKRIEVAVSLLPGDTHGMIYEKKGTGHMIDVLELKSREAVVGAMMEALERFPKE